MTSFNERLNRYLEYILAFLLAVMVLDVTWQVASRFILRSPSSFSEELAIFLLIWISLLGGCYALQTRAHLGIDLLYRKCAARGRKNLEVVIFSVIIVFSLLVLVIGGSRLVQLTFRLQQTSPALGFPMGFVYLILPVSGVICILYAAGFLLEGAGGKKPSRKASYKD